MKVTKWWQAIAIVGKLKQFNNYFDYDHQPDEHQENSQKNQQTIDSSSCLDTVCKPLHIPSGLTERRPWGFNGGLSYAAYDRFSLNENAENLNKAFSLVGKERELDHQKVRVVKRNIIGLNFGFSKLSLAADKPAKTRIAADYSLWFKAFSRVANWGISHDFE